MVRISGDASVAGQLRKTADGRAECDFPERLIMIANHQVRTILECINSIILTFDSFTQIGFTSGG